MVYPLWQTLLFSVSDVKFPTFESTFSGFRHFIAVITQREFPRVLTNTLVWVLGSVFFQFTLALLVAVFLNNNFRGRVIVQTIALLPWTVPSIVAGNTWKWILQTDFGLLNAFLKQVGMPWLASPWLTNPHLALGSVLVATIWQGYPFLMIMLLAGIKAIPLEQYEAAEVDGASTFQQFYSITLPNLKNIIVIVILLQVVWAWNAFDLIFVMTGGGPGGATEILGLFIYRLGMKEFKFSDASAVSVMLLLLVLATMAARAIALRGEKGK